MGTEIVVNELVYNVTLLVTEQVYSVVIALDSLSGQVLIAVTTTPHIVTLTAATGGLKGDRGDSAYQIWLNEGNEGTEQDFLDSLRPFNMTIGPTPPSDPIVNDLWINTNI